MYNEELEEQIIEENGFDIYELSLEKYPEYKGIDIEDDENYFDLYYEYKYEILQPYLDEKLYNNYI